MFNSLSLLPLLLIFGGAAAAVWVAGTRLSKAVDALSDQLGIGEAFGGLILLAIVTNLPEIAITASAALGGHIEVAVGNILGGIAIQTVVLVLLDGFGIGRETTLTHRAASLVLVLEGVLVIAILIVVIMMAQMPDSLAVRGIGPGGFIIAAVWISGLLLVGKARTGLPWQRTDRDQRSDSGPEADKGPGLSMAKASIIFAIAAVVTLGAGVTLERSGNAIAGHIGMSGVLFAATILAASTSLPEISTGLEAVRLGDIEMAVSDILGGNAFLPVLFLEAAALTGGTVLPKAQPSDLYLAGLGAALTAVYVFGLTFGSSRQKGRLGLDSWVVVVLYAFGIAGLAIIVRG
jgi:cation:H+ antiporter